MNDRNRINHLMDIITLVLSSDEDHSAANVSVDSYSVSCSHDLSADIQQQIDGSSYHGYIPFLVESYPHAVWPYVNNNREKKLKLLCYLIWHTQIIVKSDLTLISTLLCYEPATMLCPHFWTLCCPSWSCWHTLHLANDGYHLFHIKGIILHKDLNNEVVIWIIDIIVGAFTTDVLC